MRPWATAAACAVLVAVSAAGGAGASSRDEVVETVEGVVTSAAERPAEGGLAVVVIRVETAGVTRELLLAPRRTLEDAGLPLVTGDRVRVRVLKDDADGPDRVHRIDNLTRSWSARLRTLRGVPMWNAEGAWQGSRTGPDGTFGRGSRPGGSGGGGRGGGRGGGGGGGAGGRR